MTYRDDRDALEARVKALEGDLAEANETVRRLRGEAPSATTSAAAPAGKRVRGIYLAREVDGQISDQGYEAIGNVLRERLGSAGNVSMVGRTLTYRFQGVELDVVRTAPGRTRIDLRTVLDMRAIVTVLAATTGLLMVPPVALAMQAMGGPKQSLWLVAPALLIGAFFAWRALFAMYERSRRAHLTGVVEAVAELAAAHPLSPRLRAATARQSAATDEAPPVETTADDAEESASSSAHRARS